MAAIRIARRCLVFVLLVMAAFAVTAQTAPRVALADAAEEAKKGFKEADRKIKSFQRKLDREFPDGAPNVNTDGLNQGQLNALSKMNQRLGAAKTDAERSQAVDDFIDDAVIPRGLRQQLPEGYRNDEIPPLDTQLVEPTTGAPRLRTDPATGRTVPETLGDALSVVIPRDALQSLWQLRTYYFYLAEIDKWTETRQKYADQYKDITGKTLAFASGALDADTQLAADPFGSDLDSPTPAMGDSFAANFGLPALNEIAFNPNAGGDEFANLVNRVGLRVVGISATGFVGLVSSGAPDRSRGDLGDLLKLSEAEMRAMSDEEIADAIGKLEEEIAGRKADLEAHPGLQGLDLRGIAQKAAQDAYDATQSTPTLTPRKEHAMDAARKSMADQLQNTPDTYYGETFEELRDRLGKENPGMTPDQIDALAIEEEARNRERIAEGAKREEGLVVTGEKFDLKKVKANLAANIGNRIGHDAAGVWFSPGDLEDFQQAADKAVDEAFKDHPELRILQKRADRPSVDELQRKLDQLNQIPAERSQGVQFSTPGARVAAADNGMWGQFNQAAAVNFGGSPIENFYTAASFGGPGGQGPGWTNGAVVNAVFDPAIRQAQLGAGGPGPSPFAAGVHPADLPSEIIQTEQGIMRRFLAPLDNSAQVVTNNFLAQGFAPAPAGGAAVSGPSALFFGGTFNFPTGPSPFSAAGDTGTFAFFPGPPFSSNLPVNTTVDIVSGTNTFEFFRPPGSGPDTVNFTLGGVNGSGTVPDTGSPAGFTVNGT